MGNIFETRWLIYVFNKKRTNGSKEHIKLNDFVIFIKGFCVINILDFTTCHQLSKITLSNGTSKVSCVTTVSTFFSSLLCILEKVFRIIAKKLFVFVFLLLSFRYNRAILYLLKR